MKKILVLGLGKFGHRLVERLGEYPGLRLHVLDRNSRLVDAVAENVHTAVSGNLNDPRVLDDLLEDIGRPDLAILSLGDASHTVTLIALRLREAGVPRIVIKAEDREHRRVLRAIDKGFPGEPAFEVVIPELDSADALALRLSSRRIQKELDLGGGLRIVELTCPPGLLGATLAELEFRQRYRLTLLGWRRPGQAFQFAGADTVLEEGCLVTVIGMVADVEVFEREAERQ